MHSTSEALMISYCVEYLHQPNSPVVECQQHIAGFGPILSRNGFAEIRSSKEHNRTCEECGGLLPLDGRCPSRVSFDRRAQRRSGTIFTLANDCWRSPRPGQPRGMFASRRHECDKIRDDGYFCACFGTQGDRTLAGSLPRGDEQIVHDSIHGRPGWTREYVLDLASAAVGYGSVAVDGPWRDNPTLYEFYVKREHRTRTFDLFADLVW